MSPIAERRSTCYMCTADCEIRVSTDGDEIHALEMPDCVRGHAMLEHRDAPDRLLHPMLRRSRSAAWSRATWDASLDDLATSLLACRREHGPESVVFAVGYTKEVRPYVQRLAYLFGSPHYVTESSCCFASAYVAATLNFGEAYGYFLGPSRANRPETRCRLVWSNNPAASQLPYERHHLLQDNANCPVILVDPRRTSLADHAAIHLQLRPGTDGALALGLAHVILHEGLEDAQFLAQHAFGFDRYRDYVQEFTPSRVREITGVETETLVAAARLYATSRPAQITISPNATTHHSNGFQNHRAILLLAALTGNLDVIGGNRPWPQRLLAKDITLRSELLPTISAERVPQLGQDRFPIFTSHYPEGQGMELADAIESGRIRAVVSIGMNVMMWPHSRRLASALRHVEHFAICDFQPSPTLELATHCFPAATHLERDALIVAGNGKVRRRPAVVRPRGEARSDTELVFGLAERLGLAARFWNGDIAASFEERLEPTGLHLGDLGDSGDPVELPIPKLPERGHTDAGFGTPSGLVEFVSSRLEDAGYDGLPVYREPYWSPVSRPDLARDYPLVLTTGGRSPVYTHSQGRNLESLRRREPEARVQISPADAAARAIGDGDEVVVSSPIGQIVLKAWVTSIVPAGVVQCPFRPVRDPQGRPSRLTTRATSASAMRRLLESDDGP